MSLTRTAKCGISAELGVSAHRILVAIADHLAEDLLAIGLQRQLHHDLAPAEFDEYLIQWQEWRTCSSFRVRGEIARFPKVPNLAKITRNVFFSMAGEAERRRVASVTGSLSRHRQHW